MDQHQVIHFLRLRNFAAQYLFGWFYGPFLLTSSVRPSVSTTLETSKRRVLHVKMIKYDIVQSLVDQSIRGYKDNSLFVDDCFPPDNPKYYNINTRLKNRYF